MSKFFGALLLIATIIGTAAACEVADEATCIASMTAEATKAVMSGNVADQCTSYSNFAKCLTGVSCYPDAELTTAIMMGDAKTAKEACLAGIKQLEAGKCPATTCDSGSSIAPAVGMITAIFATMLKMLA